MRICNRRGRCLCFALGLTALVFIVRDLFLFYMFATRRLADNSYFQTSTCPACFGRGLCRKLEDRLWVSPLLADVRASFKGVRYAVWDNPTEGRLNVVAKTLAHGSEMSEFDVKLCLYVTGQRYCSVEEAAKLTGSAGREQKSRDKELFNGWDDRLNLSDYFTCPSSRLERKLMSCYDTDGDGLLDWEEQRILATTLKVNREPVILQLFPQEQGWPFPRYHGSCGRTIIAENGGKTLTEYMKKSWDFRVWLSVQLLQIAFLLTNNNLGWAVYLTDMVPENFALSENGQVLAIDVEHAEVVDLWEMKAKGMQNDRDLSLENPLCDHNNVNCGSHSIDAMCHGQERDHNFIFVCKSMLGFSSQGRLLNNPPAKAKDTIESLLRDCIYYSNSSRPRPQAAEELLHYLVSLLPEGPDQANLMQKYS